jgi:hypothetical protein
MLQNLVISRGVLNKDMEDKNVFLMWARSVDQYISKYHLINPSK